MEYNDMNVSRLNFYLFTSDKYVRNYTKQGKDCHAIGFLLSGEGKLHVNEQNIALKPGDAFFIAKGTRYYSEWIPKDGRTHSFYALHFDFAIAPNGMAFDDGLIKVLADQSLILPLMRSLEAELQKPAENKLKALSIFLGILSVVAPQIETGKNSRCYNSVLPAIEYITAHLDLSADSDYLAKICHLSRARFFVAFKSATGTTPLRYSTDLKLKAAEKILLSPSYVSVERLAEQFGFMSSVYFIKQFKNKYGATPFQYKKAHRDRAEGL